MFTNEEKRVSVYKKVVHPTIPQNVKSDTPLERLDLNWREADLPEKIRTKHVHRLHPYLGKFIPQLVEVFLRKYFVAGQTILDPFVGSGTTLVQANELGIHAIGHDVSAFNIILCRAKTARYDLQKVKVEVHDLIGKARARTQTEDRQLSFWGERRGHLPSARLSAPGNEYLQTWFAPRALHELLAYRDLIDSEGYEYRDLLKIILCRSARSARLTTHFDLDFPKRPQIAPYWCYKHARECQPTTEAFKFLERYSVDSLKRIQEFSRIHTNAKTMIHHCDSRKAVIPPIDGIITSPPYVGLIDYHEQHAYAYHLLGLDDKREQEIGPAAGGSSKAARQKYQQDIAAVFISAAQAIRRGGRMIVVAADKNELYGKIAELAGVEVEAVVQRHVNRRTGRRSTEFYESVFIWKKIDRRVISLSAISATTREKIKGFLEGFIQGLINEYKSRTLPRIDPKNYLSQVSPEGRLKPFHAAIIPPELLRINAFERSFSTRLGSTFEECARLIALEHHFEAQRGCNVSGKVSLSALNEIEKQIAIFEHAATTGKPRPSLQHMIKSVLAARRKTDLQDRVFRADLYILAYEGSKLFFEMKSPMPNKGQCLEVTQRILRFHLLHGQARPKVKAYFAMAYNPYGPNRSDYRWTYARNYMPFDQTVLLGHEFWEMIGEPNTYEELLEIYREIGREKGKGIIDALGFDF